VKTTMLSFLYFLYATVVYSGE